MIYATHRLLPIIIIRLRLIMIPLILILIMTILSNLIDSCEASSLGTKDELHSSDRIAPQGTQWQIVIGMTDSDRQWVLPQNKGVDYQAVADSESDTGLEVRNLNNWITINHDIHSTRFSNQTTISKDNVAQLKVKWILFNNVAIQDPPIIIGSNGFVQDDSGAIIAFETKTGTVLWRSEVGSGPTMGLTFSNGTLYAATGYHSTVVAIDPINGKIIWESDVLGDSKSGYNIPSYPIVW